MIRTNPSSAVTHEAIANWLADPAAYDHAPKAVEQVQTHISRIFLADSLVYKLKKPVRFDFLDFMTLAARESACREEVRLNRRLAPHVYLGVLPVTREADGEFALEGRGEVVDWVVKMRRLPQDLMLDSLHQRGLLRIEHVDGLAASLTEFYERASPLAITSEQYRSHCEAHVQGNRTSLLADSHLSHNMVRSVHAFQLQMLHCRREIFDARVSANKILDGHGDLRPEHICFTDPIAIFDCIEFNADFRRIDVLDELAFLAAECDFIGAEWVGPRLLDRYRALSRDRPPEALFDFYRAYRASVRAKIAVLRAAQLTGVEREKANREAARHLDLAARYSKPHARPLVLAVGGLSGTGKTTLARELAVALGAELLRTDVIRQEIFGASNAAKYHPDAREQVYREMLGRAAGLHHSGVSVVLDATFSSAERLYAAQRSALHPRAVFLAVECHCRPDLACDRITKRRRSRRDASEADLLVLARQRAEWEPWPEDIPHCGIDTENPLSEQMEQVLAELSRHWK